MNKITDTGMPALLEAGGDYDLIEDRLRQTVRATIETLFEEELEAFIGLCRYGRGGATKKGFRPDPNAKGRWLGNPGSAHRPDQP